MPNLGGLKNRISGVEIKDLMISGGASNNGIGIDVKYDNDRCRISNLIGINLNYGIRVKSADAMMIQDSWICEVQNSIEMTDGIQNMISNFHNLIYTSIFHLLILFLRVLFLFHNLIFQIDIHILNFQNYML